jgi:hypothetical protein
MSKRRAGVNGEQLTKLIEFEHALAGVMDWVGRDHQGWFYGTAAEDRIKRANARTRRPTGVAAQSGMGLGEAQRQHLVTVPVIGAYLGSCTPPVSDPGSAPRPVAQIGEIMSPEIFHLAV